MDSEEFNIPEISFNMTKFECLGQTFHVVIVTRQIAPMKKFFDKLETTQMSWYEAKSETINELAELEFPNFKKLPDDLKEKFIKSSRSIHAFQQMESSPKVRDFILQLSRDRKLNKLL
jgi:hypothetical protein